MHFLTAEQVEQLADAITDPTARPAGHGAGPNWRTHLPEYGMLIRLAAYTGLRAGEIGASGCCLTAGLDTLGRAARQSNPDFIGSRLGHGGPKNPPEIGNSL